MMIFIIMIIVIVMMMKLMTMVIMAGDLSARISLLFQLQPVMMMMILKRIILLIKIMGLPKVTAQFMYRPY